MSGQREKKNRRWMAFLRRILLIVSGLIIGVNVYLFNAKNLVGNQMPMPFGTGMAVVLSGSMEPVLSVDDLIIVRESAAYEVGDIVVFQDPQGLVVHRIIAAEGEMVQTQGDANTVADAPIPVTSIKGEMVAAVPHIGAFVQLLKKPAGILTVLAIAFLLVELSYRREQEADTEELEKIKAEIRKLREEQERED